jgi:hypothetical protein
MFVRLLMVAVCSLFMVGCSDPTGKSGFSEVGSGLTNFSVACRKHDGLDTYKTKGKTTYITCNNGKKFTYRND